MLSVILPSYNEEKLILKTAQTVAEILEQEKIKYELVFVDDGSKDTTWEKIKKASNENSRIIGVHFSRNFGKEAAMLAGLANAEGDCCVIMDCDLQHPPATIIEMYNLWMEGYEVVEGRKASRGKERYLHKKCAGIFYKLISTATKIDMSKASDFKLLDRKVVDVLLKMPERNAFFRALSAWVGFKTITVEFDVQEREAGESKWSTWSLIKYALTNIVAFSAVPMQIVTIAGGITFLFALMMSIQTLTRFLMGRAVEGFTTVILLILLIGSVVMLSLGIMGYYISKIYEEVKKRPRYIISKIVRHNKES